MGLPLTRVRRLPYFTSTGKGRNDAARGSGPVSGSSRASYRSPRFWGARLKIGHDVDHHRLARAERLGEPATRRTPVRFWPKPELLLTTTMTGMPQRRADSNSAR